MTEIPFAKELDASGLICPEPVMLLHKAVREVAAGEVIKVIATDPSTRRDIAHFCDFLDHELVAQCDQGEFIVFFVKKRGVKGPS